jgi:hypothetical protein
MARSRKGQAYRIESETPNEAALTAVAAVVRFSDLAMRVIPAFSFAMVLSVRTSSFVHERRVVFVFLANLRILFSFGGPAFYRQTRATTRLEQDKAVKIS